MILVNYAIYLSVTKQAPLLQLRVIKPLEINYTHLTTIEGFL